MTGTKVKEINAEVNAALAVIAKKHGMVSFKTTGNISVEGGRDNISAFRIKVEAIVSAGDVDAQLVALGLPVASYGRVINYDGKKFLISGANPGKPKFGVSAVDIATNKTYSLVTASVIRILNSVPA